MSSSVHQYSKFQKNVNSKVKHKLWVELNGWHQEVLVRRLSWSVEQFQYISSHMSHHPSWWDNSVNLSLHITISTHYHPHYKINFELSSIRILHSVTTSNRACIRQFLQSPPLQVKFGTWRTLRILLTLPAAHQDSGEFIFHQDCHSTQDMLVFWRKHSCKRSLGTQPRPGWANLNLSTVHRWRGHLMNGNALYYIVRCY